MHSRYHHHPRTHKQDELAQLRGETWVPMCKKQRHLRKVKVGAQRPLTRTSVSIHGWGCEGTSLPNLNRAWGSRSGIPIAHPATLPSTITIIVDRQKRNGLFVFIYTKTQLLFVFVYWHQKSGLERAHFVSASRLVTCG